jgi:FixJ family two-component response regulator
VIIVVDDDPSVLKSVGRLLKAHGFETRLFSSAEAYKAEAGATGVACLILDVQLGAGSGLDLQRELLRAGSPVPVIFITASDSETTRRSAAEVGCIACLSKPLTATSLMEAVKKAIETKH